MPNPAKPVFSRLGAAVTGAGLLSLLRTRTIVALIILLFALVAGIELTRPGTVNALWASNMLLFAAPLGIVAAGQTLVMLTGGIDLSVASVATASAYLMATHSGLGVAPAIFYGLGVGFAVGIINGIGVALLRVQPLVMTLGTGLMTEGLLVVYSQKKMAEVYLLPSVAAVIIGGTSIFGGRGGYSGTIIGALILTVLNSILTLLDVPESVRQILYGAIILVLAAAYTRLTD